MTITASGFVRNTVLRYNHAAGSGANLGRGGAVFLSTNSNPEFINCLFHNNSATLSGTALHLINGSLKCRNCTIATNPVGSLTALRVDQGTHQFWNSIFWNNTTDISSSSSVILDNSMIQHASLPPGTSGMNVLFNTDPLFVNLATSNFATTACSPATNTANNSYNTSTLDILGNARIVGGTMDRGAFENTTGIPSTIVTNTSDSGAGSLRKIIEDACTGDTISFSNTLLNQTILLTGPQIVLSKNLIIDGLGLDQLTVSANGTHRHFLVNSGVTATIQNINLTEGNSPDANEDGNCIRNLGNLTLQNARVKKKVTAANPITIFTKQPTGQTTAVGQVIVQ
jgi:hypothetical protein